MMTAACYKNGNDDKSNSNEEKVCSLLRRWNLVGHVLNHVLDHVLDYMIIGFMIKMLQ